MREERHDDKQMAERAEAALVKIVTINETIRVDRKGTVVHLDIEGYEKQASIRALATIRPNRPFLISENVPSKSWFTEHLQPLGYRIDRRIHCNMSLAPTAVG